MYEAVHSGPLRFIDPSGLDTTMPEHPGALPCRKRAQLNSPQQLLSLALVGRVFLGLVGRLMR